jgi:secreted trypsin-like serine protease
VDVSRRRLLLLVLAILAGCSGGAGRERVSSQTASIQDGVQDTAHNFAVAIVQRTTESVVCSGVLLAPNLVATARHCVQELSSPLVDCSSTVFGATTFTDNLLVTADPRITASGRFIGVQGAFLPQQDAVCGNDIALLVLADSVSLPGYVVPVIDPPMTDPSYGTSVAVIGYGIASPQDNTGGTAGVRRLKEGVELACIAGDPQFVDCLSNPELAPLVTHSEFMSADDSACAGDSGSAAFDQASFSNGQWVSFGIDSRGNVSSNGQDCTRPIYERFDAWATLLTNAADYAARAGGYAPPAWTSTASRDGGPGRFVATAADAASTETPVNAEPPMTADAASGSGCGIALGPSNGGGLLSFALTVLVARRRRDMPPIT